MTKYLHKTKTLSIMLVIKQNRYIKTFSQATFLKSSFIFKILRSNISSEIITMSFWHFVWAESYFILLTTYWFNSYVYLLQWLALFIQFKLLVCLRVTVHLVSLWTLYIEYCEFIDIKIKSRTLGARPIRTYCYWITHLLTAGISSSDIIRWFTQNNVRALLVIWKVLFQ